MGVFKKLSGNDVRVTPIQVKYNKNNYLVTQATGSAEGFSDGKLSRSNITGVGTGSEALLYSSIRQLFYGPFLTQTFITSESIFNTSVSGTVSQKPNGVFSRFDPSFLGLYNENQELMMVAKLSKPNQLNSYTDTNFIIRLDR
jgi:hypothetical protein